MRTQLIEIENKPVLATGFIINHHQTFEEGHAFLMQQVKVFNYENKQLLTIIDHTWLWCNNILDSGATLAITFKDTTKARLEFFDTQNTQIGSGFFEYSSNPVEGTFVEFVFGSDFSVFGFFTDLSQIPDDQEGFIVDSISISASEDYRLITNIEAQIQGVKLDPIFDNVLTPGDSFSDVLLFRPTETEFFVPDLDGISSISIGDGRDPALQQKAGWGLRDNISAVQANQDVFLSDNGSTSGFVVGLPSGVDGTWTAQAIPEPLTILGTATALGFGVFFQKKKLSSKTQ